MNYAFSMLTSERFSGVHMNLPPETPQTKRFVTYVRSIASADVLFLMLDRNFMRIDGALVLTPNAPVVQHTAVHVGGSHFTNQFRAMVAQQVQPAGAIEGAWIPPHAYEPLADQVKRPVGLLPAGELVAVGAMSFPYQLRPGGDPLRLPPPLHGLLRDGEEPPEPLYATGDPDLDSCAVNVIQAVYGTQELITGRVGLVWDDPRAVPFALHKQITARRQGQPLQALSPLAVAEQLIAATKKPAG